MSLSSILTQVTGLSTFAQIICILPLALDWLGPPSFLVCSLLLTLHQLSYSTLRLACKNTVFAPLVLLLNLISPLVPATCGLLTIYLYLYPANANGGGILAQSKYLIGVTLPTLYAAALRFVSPIFTVLEGFATLLCAQLAGRMSKGFVDSGTDDREEGIEWRRLGLLVVAAGLYCAGFAWLIKAYPLTSPTASQLHPILLGASLATVFFLTLIGFARRRATVIETALVFLYVIYSAWMSGNESAMEPRQFGSGWLTTGWGKSKPPPITTSAPPHPGAADLNYGTALNPLLGVLRYFTLVITGVLGIDLDKWLARLGIAGGFCSGRGLPGDNVAGLAMGIAGQSTESIRKIALSLPPTLLISLCFRLAVLHLASRIIPAIRRASAGWDGAEGYDEETVEKEGFWDGRRLGEEAPSVRFTTILLSYRRAILITVYTHLLLLDNGSQVWWRWVNIFLFMGVWALELLFEDEFDDDAESIKGWKVD